MTKEEMFFEFKNASLGEYFGYMTREEEQRRIKNIADRYYAELPQKINEPPIELFNTLKTL